MENPNLCPTVYGESIFHQLSMTCVPFEEKVNESNRQLTEMYHSSYEYTTVNTLHFFTSIDIIMLASNLYFSIVKHVLYPYTVTSMLNYRYYINCGRFLDL